MKITGRIIGILAGCAMFCSCTGLILAMRGAGIYGVPVAVFGMTVALGSIAASKEFMRQARADLSPEVREIFDELMTKTRHRDGKGYVPGNKKL